MSQLERELLRIADEAEKLADRIRSQRAAVIEYEALTLAEARAYFRLISNGYEKFVRQHAKNAREQARNSAGCWDQVLHPTAAEAGYVRDGERASESPEAGEEDA